MYIIGTAGPNIKQKALLKGIIDNGINILRLNFAHGTKAEYLEFLKMVKSIDKDFKILLDLSGTKIRVSNKFQYIYKVYDGEEIFFCGEDKYEKLRANCGKVKIIPLNIKDDLLRGKNYEEISIKDNTMNFKILDMQSELIKSLVIKGGIIRSSKGCNIKELDRSKITLSKNDREAIIWAINNKVDIICQSFVEEEKNIKEIKEFLNANSSEEYRPKIWGKIETLKGVNNIQTILRQVDGIVIGRGDLIPETSIEDTPFYEDKIIEEVLKLKNKDIIIATHLFNSMKNGKRPSICEVECIYSFIRRGVTGFLLAGETSVGKTPLKTVSFLKYLIDKYSLAK